MYASFGSKVTVLEGGNKFIAREDRDIADAVKETLEKKGIEIRLNARAQSIQDTADGVTLTYTDTADGRPVTIEGDAILVATGRKPMTEGLNLRGGRSRSRQSRSYRRKRLSAYHCPEHLGNG